MKKKDRKRNILTISLITALSGLFAIGLYNNQPYKETKAESETTNYTINMGGNAETFYIDNNGYNSTSKQNLESNTNYLQIYASYYSKMEYTGTLNNNNQPYYYVNNTNQTLQSRDTQNFLILQITPYNINRDTQITITLNLTLDRDLTNLMQLKYKYIRSTDNRLQTYLDRQDWTLQNSVYNYYQSLYDPNRAYDFIDIQDHTRPTTLQNENVEITQDLQVVAYTTNYYIFYFVPQIINNGATINYYGFGGLSRYIDTGHIVITGTNIINNGGSEIVDIPSIMFQVLTMPFSFISIAFNLTLFPGTPYQVNISTLLLTFIGIMIIIFILKILVALKSGA